ncbi:MAG: hypothetical protein ACE5IB_03610 [Candidatus Geothermarchaeales archaeon]
MRQVQRALKLSTSSLAAYHLEKLAKLGLVEKRYGNYRVQKKVMTGALSNFVLLGRLMLPRHFFYAVFFSAMLLTYLVRYPLAFSVHSVVALIFGVAGSLILWYETIRIWRKKPA